MIISQMRADKITKVEEVKEKTRKLRSESLMGRRTRNEKDVLEGIIQSRDAKGSYEASFRRK